MTYLNLVRVWDGLKQILEFDQQYIIWLHILDVDKQKITF